MFCSCVGRLLDACLNSIISPHQPSSSTKEWPQVLFTQRELGWFTAVCFDTLLNYILGTFRERGGAWFTSKQTEHSEEEHEDKGGGGARWPTVDPQIPLTSPVWVIQMVLFVLLRFRLHPLGFNSLLLWLLLLGHWGELGLADLVSSGLAELLGFLVEFVQVELSDDVLLMETSQAYKVLNIKTLLWNKVSSIWIRSGTADTDVHISSAFPLSPNQSTLTLVRMTGVFPLHCGQVLTHRGLC